MMGSSFNLDFSLIRFLLRLLLKDLNCTLTTCLFEIESFLVVFLDGLTLFL
jgi:hypothetical protein